MGRIPNEGDRFEWGGSFEVVDMDRHRIDNLLITRTTQTASEADLSFDGLSQLPSSRYRTQIENGGALWGISS